MAKKTEQTSKGVIKGLLAKAWEKAKELPRKLRGTKADVEARERKRIAEKTGRSAKQIRDIEQGKRPGKNLLEPLKQIKRGRKVSPPPKEEKKVTRRKKPTPPPVQPPPPKEPTPPPVPSKVKVTIKGNIAPFPDPDYLKKRRISVMLEGDQATNFFNQWEGDQREQALNYAVAAYFSQYGEGYLEPNSLYEMPVIEYQY